MQALATCSQSWKGTTVSANSTPHACHDSSSLISHKSDASATLGPIPGWKSRTHKRYTSKDQALLRQLQEACNGSEQTSA